jgi:hypothetical protein
VAYGRLAEHWMVPGELVAGAAVTSD